MIPSQVIPYSDKDEQFAIDTIKGVIDNSAFGSGPSSKKASELQECYDYYSGRQGSDRLGYVTNPDGTKKARPARMRNVNIIKGVVNTLLGEKAKRRSDYTVQVTNPDVFTRREQALMRQVQQSLYGMLLADLAQQGVIDRDTPPEQIPTPEQAVADFNRTWKDARAEMGQEALNYLKQSVKLSDKISKAWKDYVISAHCYALVEILNDDVYLNILNPINSDYSKDADSDLIEDGEWFVYRTWRTKSSLLQRHHGFLDQEQVKRIESIADTGSGSSESATSGAGLAMTDVATSTGPSAFSSQPSRSQGLIEEIYATWKSVRKVGYLFNPDQGRSEIVDEGYVVQPGDSIEWFWIPEVWQGYRIAGDMFIRIGPHPVQRDGKLPVTGVVYDDRNSEPTSLVMIGKPFQDLYDILTYRMELAFARAKEVVGIFNYDLIPENWTVEQWLYEMETTGIAWEQVRDGSILNPQAVRYLDLSVRSLEQYLSVRRSIKEDWEEVSGISRQRRGDVSQYDLKSTVEQSIVQSSHITEDLYRVFSMFERSVHQALLDYSKAAWTEGKKAVYMDDDRRQVLLSIDGIEHSEAEYGIFATDAGKERELLDNMKAYALQNTSGAPLSVVAEVLSAENMAKLRRRLAEIEDTMNQAENERAQAMAEQIARSEDRQHAMNMEIESMKTAAATELLMLQLQHKDDPAFEKLKLQVEDKWKAREDALKARIAAETERANKASEQIELKKVAKMGAKPAAK